MTAAERGVLLLCAQLPDGEKPLTMAQFRTLSMRAHALGPGSGDPLRELHEKDLHRLGYGEADASRIVHLLAREAALDGYLARAAKLGIVPLTRISPAYPKRLAAQLGMDCPPVLFVRGDLRLLQARMIGVVGSRALRPENRAFAEAAGRLIAGEHFTLVSGGAPGADSAAQQACLSENGSAVIFPATQLCSCQAQDNLCHVSEDGFDLPFSTPRALRRNRLIHAMGEKTLVAQAGLETGGTWAGTTDNLRRSYSPVFVFDDGSDAANALSALGAQPVTQLDTLAALQAAQLQF